MSNKFDLVMAESPAKLKEAMDGLKQDYRIPGPPAIAVWQEPMNVTPQEGVPIVVAPLETKWRFVQAVILLPHTRSTKKYHLLEETPSGPNLIVEKINGFENEYRCIGGLQYVLSPAEDGSKEVHAFQCVIESKEI